MLPVVAEFSPWPPGRPVETVATILDDPHRHAGPPPPRYCRCGRRVVRGLLRDGLGPKCWQNANRRPAGKVRARTPRAVPADDGPDLLDLLAEAEGAVG